MTQDGNSEKAKEQDLWARNRTDVRKDLIILDFFAQKSQQKSRQKKKTKRTERLIND